MRNDLAMIGFATLAQRLEEANVELAAHKIALLKATDTIASLEPYLEHKHDCARVQQHSQCTCGLAQLLKEIA